MSRFLFLSRRMMLGYGVDLEVHEVASQLVAFGHRVTVLCLDTDGTHGGYPVQELLFASVEEVELNARRFRPDVIVAFTSPFFEILPMLPELRTDGRELLDMPAEYSSADSVIDLEATVSLLAKNNLLIDQG